MANLKVELKYSPYNLRTTGFFLESGEELKNVLPQYMRNKRLQEWVHPCKYMNETWIGLFQKISHELGRKQFDVIFTGREVDFESLSEAHSMLDQEYKVKLFFEKRGETDEKIDQLLNLLVELDESPIPEVKAKLKEPLEETLSGEFAVGVFGNMSSGKSTFINALVGEKLLETSTDECTHKVVKIYDEDKRENFQIKYLDLEKGEEITVDTKDVSKETLHSLYQDQNYDEIRAYGNIDFIDNDLCKLVLIDTPGVGTRNEDNGSKAYEMLNNLNSVKMILLDAAQVEMEDTKEMIENIADKIRFEDGTIVENVFFVINKMDELVDAEDNPQKKIDKVKQILEVTGIKHVKIFPLYSLGAYVIKRALRNKDSLLPAERTRYKNLLEWIDEDCYKKYNLYQYRPKKGNQENESLLEGLSNEDRALYYTGIKTIEEELKKYITTFSIPIKIESFYRKYLEVFKDELHYEKWLKERVSAYQDKQNDFQRNKSIKEEKGSLRDLASQAVKLELFIREAQEDNRKEEGRLRSYVDNNKIKIGQEIKDLIGAYSEHKGVGGICLSIIALISFLIPGGVFTTAIGGVVGGIFGLTGLSMDKDEIKKIKAQIESGELGQLRSRFENAEKVLDSRVVEIQEKARRLLEPLGIDVPEIEHVKFSEFEVKINERRMFKKTRKSMDILGETNLKKLDLMVTELEEIMYKTLDDFINEYERQSKDIFQRLSEARQKASDMLKRASEDLRDASKSMESLEKDLNELNREIEWMEKFKTQIEKLVEI